jgi:hypothetical protein
MESSILYNNYKSKSLILISSNCKHRFLFHYIENVEKYPTDIEEAIRQDVETLGWFTKHTETIGTEIEFPE